MICRYIQKYVDLNTQYSILVHSLNYFKSYARLFDLRILSVDGHEARTIAMKCSYSFTMMPVSHHNISRDATGT